MNESRFRAAASVLGVVVAGLYLQPAIAAQSKSYVLSWIVPAMYSQDGDCRTIEPVADPGRTPVESMYGRFLVGMGHTPEEANQLMIESKKGGFLSGQALYKMLLNRGRVDGQPVNIFQNPAALPDPHISTVTGKYALGFNLDGNGADSPGSFEEPSTHEKGIDNQYFRAAGCFRSSRSVSPERSGHWQEVWDSGADEAAAFLITISGEDLSRDGDVMVTFSRAIERTRTDALSKVRRDMTFRQDPNPRSVATLPGKIRSGSVILEGGHLQMDGRFITTPFDLTDTHLRLKIMPDGSLDGLLGGYQSWQVLYHFFFGWKVTIEVAFGIDVTGVYYALKNLADAEPDPATGQNQRISITYAIQAVPAFIAPPRVKASTAIVASTPLQQRKAAPIPLATPSGVTVQIPLGDHGSVFFGGYRTRSLEIQYLADAQGMALYTFDLDQPNKSACYAECVRTWLPLRAPRRAKAFGDWSLVKRRDGGKQWAYRGKPLYRFAQDDAVGRIAGAPRPIDPIEEERKAMFANAAEDDKKAIEAEAARAAELAKAPAPWKLASYTVGTVVAPQGLSIREVADANGEILVDGEGRTLYTFDGDPAHDGASCRTAVCSSDWLPLAAGRLANPVGEFTLVERSDGIRQWAYRGKALYRFRNDLEPGSVNGNDPRAQVVMAKQYYLPPQVRIGDALGRGKVLTDEHGMTLYRRSATPAEARPRSVPIFPEEGRSIGTRTCDVECMKTWIPFEAPANAQPRGFWEVLTLGNGKKQWSYKGYALYRYTGDREPGDVNGNFIYQLLTNSRLQPHPGAAAAVTSEVQTAGNIALTWSQMYP